MYINRSKYGERLALRAAFKSMYNKPFSWPKANTRYCNERSRIINDLSAHFNVVSDFINAEIIRLGAIITEERRKMRINAFIKEAEHFGVTISLDHGIEKQEIMCPNEFRIIVSKHDSYVNAKNHSVNDWGSVEWVREHIISIYLQWQEYDATQKFNNEHYKKIAKKAWTNKNSG